MPGEISRSYGGPPDGRVPSWVDDVLPTEWQRRIEAQGWKPVKDMPRDGRWIIAICNDGVTVHRISWGVARNGDVCWCEADRPLYYDDPSGLFAGWIDCPQPLNRQTPVP